MCLDHHRLIHIQVQSASSHGAIRRFWTEKRLQNQDSTGVPFTSTWEAKVKISSKDYFRSLDKDRLRETITVIEKGQSVDPVTPRQVSSNTRAVMNENVGCSKEAGGSASQDGGGSYVVSRRNHLFQSRQACEYGRRLRLERRPIYELYIKRSQKKLGDAMINRNRSWIQSSSVCKDQCKRRWSNSKKACR